MQRLVTVGLVVVSLAANAAAQDGGREKGRQAPAETPRRELGKLLGKRNGKRFELPLKKRTVTVDSLERVYRVVAPRRAKTPLPLVMVLHGGGFGGLGALHIISYTEFARVALRERFIVVYPMGVEGNWNDGRGVQKIRCQRENINDVKFLRTVVDEVAKTHPVDRSRVFSTGISNGAFMSHRLAAEASDLFAGVAPVVGGMSLPIAEKFAPPHPVSLFVIQGDSDPLVPLAGGPGRRGSSLHTDAAVAKYLKLNRIAGKPQVGKLPDADPGDGTVTETRVYRPGRDGARVQLYVVKDGGHTWPGDQTYLTEELVGKTSRDFKATEAIWEFFKSCPPRKQ